MGSPLRWALPRRILFLVLTAAAFGQQAPLVLKSTTRVVEVNAVVTDKDGQPIPDLNQSDFQILDRGKPQKISFFQKEMFSSLPVSAQKLPPNTFTNRLEQQSGLPSAVTVILLDAKNTKLTDQIYVKQEVLKYLRTIKPEDHIGVYAIGYTLEVLHDYTSDSRHLLEQLAAYKPQDPLTPALSSSPLSTDPVNTQLAEMVTLNRWLTASGMSSNERDSFATRQTIGTLDALETIAAHLASVPGRKNLIWISGGFPTVLGLGDRGGPAGKWDTITTFVEQVSHAVRALSDANVAIYAVDANGMPNNLLAGGGTSPGNHGPPDFATVVTPVFKGTGGRDTLQELASRTGGRAYLYRSDFARSIRDAVADASVTYNIGFYPVSDASDGKFHKLTLKVDRPGLTLRYRSGYYDLPESTKNGQAEVDDAVWSPLDSTAIPLTVQLKALPEKDKWDVLVRMDANSLGLEQNGDRWKATLRMLYVQKDEHGDRYSGIDNTVALNPDTAGYQRIVTQGAVLRQTIEKSAQASMLRVVVRDAAGNIGSVTVPFARLDR